MIHFVTELQHSGVDVRLLLNGIELHRGKPEDKKIIQQKVNGWMTAAGNELALYAGIPDPENIPDTLNLKCLVFKGPHGRQPSEDEALAHYAERDRAKFPTGSMQLVWKTPFASDPFYGPWRWENARPISADPSTVASALQIIQSVSAGLSEHDSESVVRFFRVYIDESARAYGLKVDRMEEQLRGMCEAWPAGEPGKPVADDYSFFVEENRRLMRIERKDGLSVFSNPKSPGSGPGRVYVSSLQEGLTIVR
jgi:hypothetical protein